MPLTDRQERFCQEYVLDLNGQAAYRRAYPSVTKDSVARAAACRLLTNVNIKERIAQLQAQRARRVDVTAADVIAGLYREATLEGKDSRSSARVAAWGWLGKHFALFVDRTESTVKTALELVEDVIDVPGPPPHQTNGQAARHPASLPPV